MDEETKAKLEHLKKQRQAKRLVFSALREQSDSDSDRDMNKLRKSDDSGFTALYSGSQKSKEIGGLGGLTIDIEATNSNEFVVKADNEFNILADTDRVSEDDRKKPEPMMIDNQEQLQDVEVNINISALDTTVEKKGKVLFKGKIRNASVENTPKK